MVDGYTLAQMTTHSLALIMIVILFLGLDNCASVTCQNNGYCADLWDSFNCNCPSGYLGYLCELGIKFVAFKGLLKLMNRGGKDHFLHTSKYCQTIAMYQLLTRVLFYFAIFEQKMVTISMRNAIIGYIFHTLQHFFVTKPCNFSNFMHYVLSI